MFTEADVALLQKDLNKTLDGYLAQSSEASSKEVVVSDPVLEYIESLINSAVNYLDLFVKQQRVLNDMVKIKKEDLETEIEALKVELEKLPDTQELQNYKKEQLLLLNLKLSSLNRF